MPPERTPETPAPGTSRSAGDAARTAGRQGEQDAWGAFGLVVSGVLVWGLVGGLVGSWLDSRVPVLIGLMTGMVGGLYLVWFRYGRH